MVPPPSEKHYLQQSTENSTQRNPTSSTSSQQLDTLEDGSDRFLNLRLEPFLSSTLMDMLDVFVYPVATSPSVPNTPPPCYEPPPPSYPSSLAASLSLEYLSDLATMPQSSDVMSIITNTSGSSFLEDMSTDAVGNDSGVVECGFGEHSTTATIAAAAAPAATNRLQNQIVLNLIVYDLLTSRTSISRTPSRSSVCTNLSGVLD